MSRYNNLSIEVYGTANTLIVDPKNELVNAEGLQYRSIYPGGLYADASFFVPRPVTDWWELNGANRIVCRNDARMCYEGYITNLQQDVSNDGEGVLVRSVGAWGHILMNWRIRKRWCDDRVTNDAWTLQTSLGTTTIETEDWQIERQSRIHITPNPGQFTSGEYVALRYAMPVAQTIARIYYAYDMAEKAGQSWEMSMYRSTDGTTYTQMGTAETYTAGSTTVHTATGVGTVDVTLATPSRYAELRFYARATNNPVNDDHNHGMWTGLKVYSETGDINMTEIVKDIVSTVTDLNSDTRFVSAAVSPLSLEPFIADNFDTAADVINQAVSQGDGAYNRWGALLFGSDRAFVPDGKPLLYLSQYNSTDDYEYVISLDDENLVLPLTISQDFDSIANAIRVRYTDQDGFTQWRTAVDNAALRDTTSINTYGRHEYVLSLGESTATIADAVGQRYLASYKDPQYRLISPVTIQGYIRGKGGMIYPASEIRAGSRLRIENYLQDVTGSGQGLTFVITQTLYDADSETCQLTAGVPDAPLMLRYTPPAPAAIGAGAVAAPSGGGGGGGRTITDEQLRKWGLTRKQWWAIKDTPRGKALRATLAKKKKKKG